MKEYTAIGLMSGTSLDGIDAALVRTDGEEAVDRIGFICVPYEDALRDALRAHLGRTAEESRDVERALTLAHAGAVARLLRETGAGGADLVGFHGHTLWHAPERGYTCQIGDGALLARLTGIQVVSDFRSADVRAGGQGAPFAPVYHRALAAGMEKPVVFLNIGGVANVTCVGEDGLFAFDTGPGNALLDDWVRAAAGRPYDENGALARAGCVDEGVLGSLLSHPYFSAPAPKSLERNAFASGAWRHLSPQDGAATLTAFTVRAVARARDLMPGAARRWIVSGGGRRNAFMMEELRKALGAPVAPIESLGLDGDATEAEAFAYLAVRSLRGLPLSFPGTTGVPRPMTGGVLHDAA